jgi:hypothetical protein
MTPARETLRAAYDAVIEEIDSARGSQQLTNAFYAKTSASVFDAGYRAISDADAANGKCVTAPRQYVVPAPMGSGKTSFSQALVTALVRLGDQDARLSYGCAFVVKEMQAADNLYRSLDALLPDRVAVWSTDHDARSKSKPKKVVNPAKRFCVEELEDHPVAIVTHAFYRGKNGHKAHNVLRNGEAQPRVLTIVDEQPEDVTIFDVSFSEASYVWETIKQDELRGAFVSAKLHPLVMFIGRKGEGSGLEKPSDDPKGWETITASLEWFSTIDAKLYAEAAAPRIPKIVEVFGFAAAMHKGCAFITRYDSDAPRFVGYENNIAVRHGMVLMDATADIDGVTQLCPTLRTHVQVPQPSYANLDIVHVQNPYTGKNLSKAFKNDKDRLAYTDWMKSVILAHVEPGQKALVVCKKKLIDDRNVPDWDDRRDPRFDDPTTYTVKYGWEIDGRKLCVTHWGTGIGENTWQDADAVLLFGEHIVPKRTSAARAQGLTGSKATEGPLNDMPTLNARSPEVDTLHFGVTRRWLKQMAMRGKGRHFDEHGVCGKQKLVCTGEYWALRANADQLFPGAVIRRVGAVAVTIAEKFLGVLEDPATPNSLSTTEIAKKVGAPHRTRYDPVKDDSYGCGPVECRLGSAGPCRGLCDLIEGQTTQWITRAATAHMIRTTNSSIERLSKAGEL